VSKTHRLHGNTRAESVLWRTSRSTKAVFGVAPALTPTLQKLEQKHPNYGFAFVRYRTIKTALTPIPLSLEALLLFGRLVLLWLLDGAKA
jgi:hypothetical protein